MSDPQSHHPDPPAGQLRLRLFFQALLGVGMLWNAYEVHQLHGQQPPPVPIQLDEATRKAIGGMAESYKELAKSQGELVTLIRDNKSLGEIAKSQNDLFAVVRDSKLGDISQALKDLNITVSELSKKPYPDLAKSQLLLEKLTYINRSQACIFASLNHMNPSYCSESTVYPK